MAGGKVVTELTADEVIGIVMDHFPLIEGQTWYSQAAEIAADVIDAVEDRGPYNYQLNILSAKIRKAESEDPRSL